MAKKRGKKYLEALKKYEPGKVYPLAEAIDILKRIRYEAFDASVEVSVNLGVDPRYQDQLVRGSVLLPHGTGKKVRVLVLTTPDKEDIAREAGADMVGLDEYLEKIGEGWVDVDVIIATQDVMPKVGRYGRILGPKKLMPSPKNGTVVPPKPEVLKQTVKAFKGGKVNFRVDKYGIIHMGIGKASFPKNAILENAKEVIQTLLALKPESLKGTYLQKVYLSTTMSPAVEVERASLLR